MATPARVVIRNLSSVLKPLVFAELGVICAVIVVCIVVIGFAIGSGSFTTKDRLTVVISATTGFGIAAATLGGLFSVLLALAPRWLSEIGLGPRLTFDWQSKNGGYNHTWDRVLRIGGREEKCAAVIARMAIRNEAFIAAESVKVKLEGIWRFDGAGNPEPLPHAKFSPLRWADSYDLDEFERLNHHRCSSIIEPLIHAGDTQFFDFCFVLEPGARFYDQAESDTQYWCVHPFYQWLPALEENAVLEPAAKYAVTLSVSAKNSHVERSTYVVECRPKESLTKDMFRNCEVIGDENTERPVRIYPYPELLLVDHSSRGHLARP